MTAVGYVGGDPAKVSRAGDTMTGPLVLPGNPAQPLQAAPKQYVDAGGGGGGGIAFMGAWSAAQAYNVGQLVTYLSSLWGAVNASTNQTPVSQAQVHTDTPVTVDSGDGAPYELGLSFSVSAPTRLLGVAFYKSAANTAVTRYASLWNVDNAGLLVARRAFPSETASGRQFCPLNYDLVPGVTTYTVSVGVPNGHYSLTAGGYNAPVTVGNVTVPVGGGVFNAGNVGNRPSSVAGNADYWVWPVWEDTVNVNWQLAARGSY